LSTSIPKEEQKDHNKKDALRKKKLDIEEND
jgi:hypothetical protein